MLVTRYSSNSINCFNSSSLHRIKEKKLKDGLVSSELVENFKNFACILTFVRQVLQSYLVRVANILNNLHNRCLRVFILTTLSRDMMINPKGINYVREKEQQLYESLMSMAKKKQEESRHMINDTLSNMRTDLLQGLHQFKSSFVDYNVNTSSSSCSSSSSSFLRYKSHFVYTLGFIISFCWSLTLSEAKGTAVIGAAGGGSDGVCSECAGNYTAAEMKVAVIILAFILIFFFGILCCQCFNRFYYEFVTKHELYADTKGMPPPPYIRRDYIKNEYGYGRDSFMA